VRGQGSTQALFRHYLGITQALSSKHRKGSAKHFLCTGNTPGSCDEVQRTPSWQSPGHAPERRRSPGPPPCCGAAARRWAPATIWAPSPPNPSLLRPYPPRFHRGALQFRSTVPGLALRIGRSLSGEVGLDLELEPRADERPQGPLPGGAHRKHARAFPHRAAYTAPSVLAPQRLHAKHHGRTTSSTSSVQSAACSVQRAV